MTMNSELPAQPSLPLTLSLGEFEMPLEMLLKLHQGETLSFAKPEMFNGVLYFAGVPFAEVDLVIVADKADVVIKNIINDTQLFSKVNDYVLE